MTLPGWPPRDLRAFIALVASVAGAAILTGLLWRGITFLRNIGEDHPETRLEVVKALANSNYGLLAIIGAVLLSLGLAINRRSVKASGLGFSLDATGGDDTITPTVTTTTTTAVAGASTTETQP